MEAVIPEEVERFGAGPCGTSAPMESAPRAWWFTLNVLLPALREHYRTLDRKKRVCPPRL